MKSFTMPIIGAVIACGAVGFAGSANAAPSGPDASDTVMDLQSDGYHVVVNKVGAQPLDQCSVSAVRPGHTFTRMESEVPGPNDTGVVTSVTAKTVYVDVSC
jgi:hypothetical protein